MTIRRGLQLPNRLSNHKEQALQGWREGRTHGLARQRRFIVAASGGGWCDALLNAHEQTSDRMLKRGLGDLIHTKGLGVLDRE